jgi:CRISPR-associated protein Cas5 subtype I-B
MTKFKREDLEGTEFQHLHKETQRALRFQLRGVFHSFREPNYTVYHRTLPFPPKNTLCGMFGAALGFSPEEVNAKMLEGDPPAVEVAVIADHFGGEASDLWKIKKVAIGEKSTEDVVLIGDKYYYGAVIVRELLFSPQYTVYVRSADDEMLEQLYHALQNPVWALSLGRDDELVRVVGLEWREISAMEEEVSYERVVLPAEKYTLAMETLQATAGRSKQIQPPLAIKLPTRFLYEEDGEREGRGWLPFVFASGLGIKPVDSRSRAYTDGENHFQFF